MQSVNAIRGDDFALTCVYQTAGGTPIPLAGLTITCRISDGSFTDDLTVTTTDADEGEFTISATDTESALWPVDSYVIADIQVDDGSTISSSDRFRVIVKGDITP